MNPSQPPTSAWSKPSGLFTSQQPSAVAVQQSTTPAQPIETPTAEQAQAHLHLTQTLDLSSKLLKSFWEIQDWTHTRLGEEFKRLQQHSEELRKRESATAAQFAEAEKKLADSEAKLETAKKQKQEAQKKEEEAKRIEAENNNALERIKPLLEKEKQIKENERAALEALQNSQNERKIAEAEKASAAEKLRQAEVLRQNILELQNQVWPPCLSGERWIPWRSDLQDKAKRDASAALLVAAFHRFRAAEKATDPGELCSALQDLGRRLYADTADPELVAQIGTAFNEASASRFQLKFARPGEPTSDQWMNYQPGLGSIRQVRNWAVFKVGTTGGFQIASKADVQ